MKLNIFLSFTLIILSLQSCSTNKLETEQKENDIALVDESEFDQQEADHINDEQFSDDTIQEIPQKNEISITVNSEYKVQKGDTLMLISFKLYGDYRGWREIKKSNPQIDTSRVLPPGTLLNVTPPKEEFVFNPGGEPYLVKSRDTLMIISKNIYETSRHWNDLYQHNKVLIHDPNKIYEGFTIY